VLRKLEIQGIRLLNWHLQLVQYRLELANAAQISKDTDQLLANQGTLGLSPFPDQEAKVDLDIPQLPDLVLMAVVLFSLPEEL